MLIDTNLYHYYFFTYFVYTIFVLSVVCMIVLYCLHLYCDCERARCYREGVAAVASADDG